MCISSTSMRPSLAEKHVNVSSMYAGHNLHQRSASSLSTESSEFEFDSFSQLIDDEPPLSPKLLYSPKLYSPNYFLYGESAVIASSNQFSADQRNIHASLRADYVEQQVYIEAPPSVLRINHASEERKRDNLRSLLNRRDLEQLPPLTDYNIESNHQINKKDIKKLQDVPAKVSSPPSTSFSSSASSSPVNYHANQSANPCKFLGNQGDASPPESKTRQKKSSKWAFKLDFFRKSPSPRADQALNQNRKTPNHVLISNRHDHCSIAAAAEKAAGFDDYFRERDNGAAAARESSIIDNYQLNQRIVHYGAVAASTEARFYHSIDHYRVAAAVITKFESPRHSTSSVISLESSPPRRAGNEMIKANYRKISESAPTSPAGSPPKSSLHAGKGSVTRGRVPMSPHALHYEQQKARTEGRRRKTFLPYRQSLLSACFFPLSTQAVY